MDTSSHRRARVPAAAAAILLVSILGFGLGSAFAQQPPDDVVLMTNGDRLTGEIKSLSRGRLSIDAKGTGVVSVKWYYIAELTSQRLFELETGDGSRFLGRLAPGTPGKLSVVGDGEPILLDLASVVGIVQMRRSFFSRMDGSISVGGTYTQSSGIAQFSTVFSVTARRPSFEWRANVGDYVTFESDGVTTERFTSAFAYSRYVSRKWAVFGGAGVERNPDLGYDVRSTIGGGIERTLLRSNRSTLVVAAGLGVSNEVPVDAAAKMVFPAIFTVRHSFFTYDTPKTSVDTTLNAVPILNQRGRWRLDLNTSLSREIFKDFAVGGSFYESYDNQPPSDAADRNDLGATLSISYTF